MALQEKDSRRPERRITLLFIAIGSIFGFIATILGALMLTSMSGIGLSFNLSLFLDHPYLQIFGFLSEFVCGVGYSIIPLFKSKKLTKPKVAYIPLSLITTANIIGIIAVVAGGTNFISLFQVLSFLILVSSLIFGYQILEVLGRPIKVLGEAELFLSMAAISFVLISAVFFLNFAFPKLLGSGSGELFSPSFIYLSLAGFTGSMIFGVELRTVAFRMTNYRKTIAKITASLQAVSVCLSFIGAFRDLGFLVSAASLTFLLSGICFSISIRIFEYPAKSRILLPLTAGRPNVASHNTISNYSNFCISSSILWLLFSLSLGVAWEIFDISGFWVRDSFIHSVAIGFIGSAIIAYGPVLLPGVLSQKAPKKHLSLFPIVFLNVGLVVRDAGNFYSTWFALSLPIWESLSGLFVVIAMILLMTNMHFGRSDK